MSTFCLVYDNIGISIRIKYYKTCKVGLLTVYDNCVSDCPGGVLVTDEQLDRETFRVLK